MISVSCTASRTSAFKALWTKLFMPVIEATLYLITSQVNPLLHASASSGWQLCRRSESMYPRASAIAFTDVGERAITHLRNTFVCDPPTEVYLSELSGGQRPPLRRERRSFAASTSSYAAPWGASKAVAPKVFANTNPWAHILQPRLCARVGLTNDPLRFSTSVPICGGGIWSMYANLSPRRNVFICSQPLANLPELVLSAIIFRIGSRCADASASDIARAAAAAPTEKKSARGLELQLLARAAFVEVEGGEGVHMQVSLGAAQRAPRCSAERICAATDFARAALHQNP